MALRGTPDFLLCIHGHFVALELKATPKDKPSELQKYNLENITKAKGLALIVHPENWETVYSYLQKLAEHGYIQGYFDTN